MTISCQIIHWKVTVSLPFPQLIISNFWFDNMAKGVNNGYSVELRERYGAVVLHFRIRGDKSDYRRDSICQCTLLHGRDILLTIFIGIFDS